VTVTCTNGTGYTVGLDAGLSTGATVTPEDGHPPTAGALNYSLTPTAHGLQLGQYHRQLGVWNRQRQRPGASRLRPDSAAQFVTPGSYTDTITATVTY